MMPSVTSNPNKSWAPNHRGVLLDGQEEHDGQYNTGTKISLVSGENLVSLKCHIPMKESLKSMFFRSASGLSQKILINQIKVKCLVMFELKVFTQQCKYTVPVLIFMLD